jgi:Leucine-rich repeat (LRR) protein
VDEVSEVRLVEKKCLRKLKLEWHSYLCNKDALHQNENIDPTQEGKVLDNLMPHSNLQDLCIRGNGGSKCPQWLGENLSVKYLESLHLECVDWKSFPPLGELWVVTEPHGDFPRIFRRLKLIKAHVPDTKFQNLRKLEITKLHGLKKWVVNSCQLFALLEVLTITHCSRLEELSFSHSTCCQQEKEAHMNWFPCLKELNISDCPQLISFPPVPWTSTPCSVRMFRVGFGYGKQFREKNHNSEHSLDGEWGYGKLFCEENHSSEHSLDNEGRVGLGFGKLFWQEKSSSEYILEIGGTDNLDIDSMFSKLLAFDNLTKLNEMRLTRCSLPPLHHLQKLSSLKTFTLDSRGSVFPLVGRVGHTEYQFPSTSPSPSFKLQSLRTDDVAGVLAAPVWTLLSSSLTCLEFEWNQEVERFTEEQEEALRHLNYLEKIGFSYCDKLQCIPAGLHGLPNLKILEITSCEAILSLPNVGLLSSLQELNIDSCKAIRSVPKECLPNSLQKLVLWGCPAIRSLPKVEDLPSSLRELDISLCKSEELTRQCRKLIGTIPIVKA